MRTLIDTRKISHRNQLEYWNYAVCDTYFQLGLKVDAQVPVNGVLLAWKLSDSAVSLSSLESSPTCYFRNRAHMASSDEPYYLITIPCLTGIYFEQDGQHIDCQPGHFIVERSDLPYRFGYRNFNKVMVLKIPEKMVNNRIRGHLRYAGLSFSSSSGLGRIFFEKIRSIYTEFNCIDAASKSLLIEQLIDTFCLIIQNDERILGSEESSLTAFHLAKVEKFMDQHLSDPELTPEKIAKGCGISVRYLYKLFSSRNISPIRRLYEKRLESIHRKLVDWRSSIPIGELAYAHGFNEQAHFSRMFKTKFGVSPTELRKNNRNIANQSIKTEIE